MSDSAPQCQSGHDMIVSDTLEGEYSNGYSCDACGKSVCETENVLRWSCFECTEDFCFLCKPKPLPTLCASQILQQCINRRVAFPSSFDITSTILNYISFLPSAATEQHVAAALEREFGTSTSSSEDQAEGKVMIDSNDPASAGIELEFGAGESRTEFSLVHLSIPNSNSVPALSLAPFSFGAPTTTAAVDSPTLATTQKESSDPPATQQRQDQGSDSPQTPLGKGAANSLFETPSVSGAANSLFDEIARGQGKGNKNKNKNNNNRKPIRYDPRTNSIVDDVTREDVALSRRFKKIKDNKKTASDTLRSHIAKSSRKLPTFYCPNQNSNCVKLRQEDIPMLLETPFVSLSSSACRRSHWVCHSCGFRSCGVCLEAITVQDAAACPLVRQFPEAGACIHVALTSSQESGESLKKPNERGIWQVCTFGPQNLTVPPSGALCKWSRLTPRQAMSPCPGLPQKLLTKDRSLSWFDSPSILHNECLHRLGVNVFSTKHPDRSKSWTRQLEFTWKHAEEDVKQVFTERWSAASKQSKLNVEESVQLDTLAKEGETWRTQLSHKQVSSTVNMFIRDQLKELRQKEKSTPTRVAKTAPEASHYIAEIWDNLTAREKEMYEDQFKEESRIKAEECAQKPKDQDVLLVQVEVLCSECGETPHEGAAVMPVSFQCQANDHSAMVREIKNRERLALVCTCCQQKMDLAMASVSMAPLPRVPIVGNLTKITPLQHTPDTYQLFNSLLSEDRDGLGSGVSACLYADYDGKQRKNGSTKFKLDYKKYKTNKGANNIFPVRLLPREFDVYKRGGQRRSNKIAEDAPNVSCFEERDEKEWIRMAIVF